ncbi:RDD family protein [Intrasporangium flavum]|uniref:RDD family protein n=1 Tax=Intrasporangium flavum TaxID=1428657 RepID=UPI00096DBFD5|nr:RDD family protein [Intrasporangium flavum]
MSQQPSGWYDDPSNPDMLRYWDGVTWTNHTAPKKSPTAPQSTIGRPYGADAGTDATGAAAPTQPGAPTPTTPMPQGGWQGQQGYQQAPYQQAPQYPGAPQGGAQWMYNVKTTADGVPLASWGKRFAAWLIDGVILAIVGGAIAWAATPNLQRSFSDMFDAAARGDQAAVQQMQSEILGPTLQFSIVLWLVVSAYCLVFWTTTAQTPGKMALGISVRRMSEPGPLPLGTAVMRRLVPLAGQFVSILSLIDYLWPLWDDKRQALHDKVASTQVVEGKQPRRQG